MKLRLRKTEEESCSCSVDIGMENIAVAAARVTNIPSRLDKKGFRNFDVNNIRAKLILLVDLGAARGRRRFTNP